MSIEPASVSNPVVRDNDNGSLRMVGNGTQGSATGRKEGQFGSFWDKAVYGAQKLFGIERPSADGIEERHSDEESNDGDESRPERSSETRLGRPVAWSQSRTAGLTGHLRREGGTSLPSFGDTDRSFEVRSESNEETTKLSEPSQRKSRSESSEESAKPEEPEVAARLEEDDDDEKEAKSADPVMPVLPARSEMARPIQRENLLNTDKQEVKKDLKPIGINSAKQAGNDPIMTSLPKVQLPQDNAQSDLSPVGNANGSSEQKPSAALTELAGAANAKVGKQATESMTSNLPAAGLAEKGAGSKHAAEIAVGKARPASLSSREELLSVNAEKAKADLSQALNKGSRSESAARNATGSDSKPMSAPVNGELVETTSKTPSDSVKGDLEAKANDSILKTPGKSPIAPIRSSETARSVANANAAVHSNSEATQEASSSKKAEANLGQDIAKELRGADLRSVDVRANANRARTAQAPLGAAVAGLQANAVSGAKAGMGAGSQSQGNGFGSSDKPASEMTGARESAPKTNATSAKSEGTQGFQLSNSQGASSSKSAFAAKAQPTSYASKGAEEVKEIYQTLSKSVERLVNTKGETVSIRINFDQGGTMALRVSMDGGQVNTTMQTDLAGLESLIKSNWSELASDWNAKGVKLNAPQFTQGGGEGSRDDGSMTFEQRESQSQNGSSSDSKAKSGRRSSTENGESHANASQVETSTDEQNGSDVGEQELLTYA